MRAIQSNPPLKFLLIRRDFRFDEKKSLFLTFLLKAQRLNRDILKNSITDFYSLKLQFRAESKKARKKSRFSKKKKKLLFQLQINFPRSQIHFFTRKLPGAWRKDRPWNGYKRSKPVAQTAFFFFQRFVRKFSSHGPSHGMKFHHTILSYCTN